MARLVSQMHRSLICWDSATLDKKQFWRKYDKFTFGSAEFEFPLGSGLKIKVLSDNKHLGALDYLRTLE